MSARPGRAHAGAWLLLLAAVTAAVLACSETSPHEDTSTKPAKGIYVGRAWELARRVVGHRQHVIERNISCASCHDLTGGSLGAPTPARCVKCHEKEGRIEHARSEGKARFGPSSPSDCTSCHAFKLPAGAPTPTYDPLDLDAGPPLGPGPGACQSCHAEAHGAVPAVKVHGTSNCLGCHRPHADAVPKAGDCHACHEDVSTTHGAAGKPSVEVCTTCHQHLHAPASAARETCQPCHATQAPLVPATALFLGGHTACVGCHQPHASSAAPTPCSAGTCHGALNVLAAATAPAHGACTSCHQPHEVRGSAARACSGCHRNVHPEHPASAGGCIGCHEPHPAGPPASMKSMDAPDTARACTTCHQLADGDHGLHAGAACTTCHAPHHFAISLAARPGCPACHAQELTRVFANSGHQACQGCHAGLPHHPEAASTTCTGCHAHQHELVRPAHAVCTSCHEPHAGAPKQACASCHAAEAHDAPRGHQACTRCHDAHSGGRIASCPTCHASEARTPHGALDGSACTRCHRPHGPAGVSAPPACTSCHRTRELAGLHAIAEHQTCTRCHTGHGGPVAEPRAACLTCHADRRQHFPSAPRCTSCHLFTDATAHGR